jgi:hypothetical protein
MTTNYRKRCRRSLATVYGSRSAAWASAMIVCASAFAMCGCGESSATVVATRQAGAEVLLLPVLRGGAAGWCITVAAGGGCPIFRLKHGPIVAEFWNVGTGVKPIFAENTIPDNTKSTDRAEGFALTTRQVAAVAVDGSRPIATRRGPGLPQGLRSVAVRIHGAWAPEVETPSLFGRPPHKAPAGLPRFTPLGRAGKPLAQRNEEGPLVVHKLAGRSWSPPAPEPAGACQLRAAQLHGLVTNAGFVVTHAKPVNGLMGRPFLSCASTSYSLAGWPMVGSVLLDARQPGAQPSSLPGMRAVTGSTGVFDALGSNGPMVARRVPGAWLVVSGGEGEAQRRTLLEHLRATVHL